MMSMELSEFVHPFVLAQCDPAALGELCKAMGGVSRGVFVVCEGLILRYPQTFKMFPSREIALAICACCQSEEKSVRLIRALAKVFPGISGIVDVNGWTPLTYMLFRQKASGGYLRGVYRGKNDAPTLEKLLIELGCDPNAKDKYGLSWREIRAVLPRASKVNEA